MAGESVGLDLASQSGQEDIKDAIEGLVSSEDTLASSSGQADIKDAIEGLVDEETGLADKAGQADIVTAISGLIQQFSNALNRTVIKTTSTDVGSLTVNENGTYDAHDDNDYDAYDEVIVDVPNTYEASDEGKVIDDGALVTQGSQNIDANGTYDTTTDSEVVVDVPNTYVAADEGKVVDNGALVAQTSATKNANGTYDTTLNNEIVVDVSNSYVAGDEGKVVSNGALVSQSSVTKTSNGTYDTTLNNEIVVDVPNTYGSGDEGKVVSNGALVSQTSATKTVNGTYDTTLINEVVINVPNSGGGSPIVEDLYLVDPDEIDDYSSANYIEGGLPVSGVMARYSSAPLFGIGSTTFDNVTEYCLYRTYTDICSLIFTKKIEGGKYSKLKMKAKVVGSSQSAQKSQIAFLSSCQFGNDAGWLGGTLIALTDTDKTASEINNQTGVTINVSTNTELPEQTVEIDLPVTDCYIAVLNWFCTIYIRELYLVGNEIPDANGEVF